MTESARLTTEQVRQAMRAVGECRDVGRDPAAWNLRVGAFLLEHVRSVFTCGFTIRVADRQPTVEQILFTFWADNRFHDRWEKLNADFKYRLYPTVQRFAARYAGKGMTVRRQDLVPDAEWVDGDERAVRRSVLQDETMISAEPHEGGLIHTFTINRADGDEPFSARDRAVVRLLHDELGRLFGSRLSLRLESQALPPDLSARQQLVFVCLLSGDSDKQIAARVGLSVHTVHEYVTALYRRFGVHSRAELFALAHRNKWVPDALPPE